MWGFVKTQVLYFLFSMSFSQEFSFLGADRWLKVRISESEMSDMPPRGGEPRGTGGASIPSYPGG